MYPMYRFNPHDILSRLRKSAALTPLLAALFCSTAAIPSAQAQLLPVGGSSTFVKGANLAWLNGQFDHDIGTNPNHPDWGCAYNSADMNRYMADMRNMGINVMRLWLHENKEGLIMSNGLCTGMNSTFLANLDDVVRLAQNNGMRLYLTLNGGDIDWVNNTARRDSYINNAVKPLINRYRGNSIIFAIDIMNEIESVIAGNTGNWTSSGATWTQARDSIRAHRDAIKSVDSSRLVTCSSGWHDWNNMAQFRNLGLDFYDYHHYADNPNLPTAASLGMDKPILIGEYGQSTTSWNDTLQSNAAKSFLDQARSKGYAGALIWNYAYPGSTDYHAMLNSNGSWRLVGTTLKNWNYGSTGTGPGNGTFRIVNRNSGKAMDANGNGTTDGTQIIQWTYGGGNNQRWTLQDRGGSQFSIIGVASGKALDVNNSDTANGTKVQLWTYGGGNNQKFTFAGTSGGYYRITPVHASGACLDVNAASTADGATVQLWSYNGGNNQQWTLQAP